MFFLGGKKMRAHNVEGLVKKGTHVVVNFSLGKEHILMIGLGWT